MITQSEVCWHVMPGLHADAIKDAARVLSSAFGHGRFEAQSLIGQLAILADFIDMASSEYDIPDWGIDWREAGAVYADRIGRNNIDAYAKCMIINMRRACEKSR